MIYKSKKTTMRAGANTTPVLPWITFLQENDFPFIPDLGPLSDFPLSEFSRISLKHATPPLIHPDLPMAANGLAAIGIDIDDYAERICGAEGFSHREILSRSGLPVSGERKLILNGAKWNKRIHLYNCGKMPGGFGDRVQLDKITLANAVSVYKTTWGAQIDLRRVLFAAAVSEETYLARLADEWPHSLAATFPELSRIAKPDLVIPKRKSDQAALQREYYFGGDTLGGRRRLHRKMDLTVGDINEALHLTTMDLFAALEKYNQSYDRYAYLRKRRGFSTLEALIGRKVWGTKPWTTPQAKGVAKQNYVTIISLLNGAVLQTLTESEFPKIFPNTTPPLEPKGNLAVFTKDGNLVIYSADGAFKKTN